MGPASWTRRAAVGLAAIVAFGASAPRLQEPPSPAIAAFVHDALRDRIQAGDIPDFNLIKDRQHLLVLNVMRDAHMTVSAEMVPDLPDTKLELLSTKQLDTLAADRHEDVAFLTIDQPVVDKETASIYLGVDLASPPKPEVVKLCCCAGKAEFRRSEDRWVFVRWARMVCS